LLAANTCKAGEPYTSQRAVETRTQHETVVIEVLSDEEFEKEKQEKEELERRKKEKLQKREKEREEKKHQQNEKGRRG